MNSSHWIKKAKSTYAPNSIVSVCVGTKEKIVKGSVKSAEVSFDHVCIAASHRRNGRWGDATYLMFKQQDDFWNWLQAYGTERRRTYCFAPVASNALTLLGFWELLTVRGAKFTREKCNGRTDHCTPLSPVKGSGPTLPVGHMPNSQTAQSDPQFHVSSYIITGKTDLLKYRSKGKSFSWTSGRQYFDCDENELANAISFKWTSEIHSSEHSTTILRNSRDRSFLWLYTLQKLCDWWRSIDGGPWGGTVGQLSLSFFRKTVDANTVLVHKNESVTALEDASIFGGRSSLFCRAPIGNVQCWQEKYVDFPPIPTYPPLTGTIAHIDVRSMYPSILARELFPVQLLQEYQSLSLSDLSDCLRDYGVIASVVLNSTLPEFPLRQDGRIQFPIGRFSTTLAGPELAYAMQIQAIEHVGHIAVYRLGQPFRNTALRLIQYRQDAQDNSDYSFELFCKSLANSLGGKLAQRQYSWVARPDAIADREWGGWITIDADTKASRVYRAVAGLVLERIAPLVPHRNMTACYSYMTAYGRLLMRSAREVCLPSLVLSQDTDGLWILLKEDGQRILERIGKAVAPYSARCNKVGTDAVFLSPSHYWVDGYWTLAGFRIIEVASSTLRVMSERTTNPITQPCDSPVSSIRIHRDIRRLSCMTHTDAINAEGFTIPHALTVPYGC